MNQKLLFLVIISVAVYINTLFNDFMWDDYTLIIDDKTISEHNFRDFFSYNYWFGKNKEDRGRFRPIRSFTFLLDSAIYGKRPFGFHMTNLILFTICVVLVYKFANMWFTPVVSFLSTLFFVVHPVHVETVAWIKNRSDLLCTIFYLGSVVLFIQLIETTKKRTIKFFISIVMFFLALLSKEMAITLPVVILLITVFKNKKEYMKLCIPYFVITILFFLCKEIFWRKEITAQTNIILDTNTHMRIILLTLNKYLTLLLLPFGLSAEHIFDYNIPTTEIITKSFSIFLFLILVAVAVVKKWRNVLFCYLLLFILLIPVTNIIFLQARPIAEQRLFMPSIGYCLFMVGFVDGIFKIERFRIAKFVLYTILLVLAVMTIKRNFIWKNDLVFWTEAVKMNPKHFRANYNLGVIYQKSGEYEKAIKYYETAAEDSSRPEIYYALGFCYDKLGNVDKSLQNYFMALKLAEKPIPDLYNNIAIGLHKKGLIKEAKEYFLAALKLDPNYEPAKWNLEELYKK